MKFFAVALSLSVSSCTAFVPSSNGLLSSRPSRSGKSSLDMKLGRNAVGMPGTDFELPDFDPIGFTQNAPLETLEWYRAAELKHGRVCMLAALGNIVAGITHLPDTCFEGKGSLGAVYKIMEERPWAGLQIVLAIFAVEALGQKIQSEPGREGGDLGFDPLGLKPSDPELLEATQLREIKNGRLAMIAILGQWAQEYVTNRPIIDFDDVV
uniref:Plastid light harvesting protein n=1 Tax=Chromera velia CCMP2878 TaxID=1169474 RepID=A0A0G4GRR2_9ALVE|mmetsp:Transcript_23623/g.46412  ORF Transcript_23623/g.46412 Transcript_23623/m.46412 type:complete len:210 (-) Transcript_23623:139-768(-)|eukprot:Cvel_23024.t1-p1 / transcript=Cvel_23024.t1 / gene=Cvel_23024 / organism=Chromera_velia_CCMP2878 / gene_product=Fucoxanthin-chlorophyll a-c binding protein,, putative / transcript_product=Fucoxanthin-chlorophyll a-c binding protein,, putative / location=Cvel_scaffold2326:3270-5288(-) / protein_length=209 / sequence_SO=supercontig / SO=protein_coding / is_pseudo=false